MRNHRPPAVLAAALGIAALQLTVAGPAAADHNVTVTFDGTSCTKATPALGIPIALRSDRAVVRTLRDGTIVSRCHFRHLPDRIDDDQFGTWVRPQGIARFTREGECALVGNGFELVFGDAEVVITPAGTLKVTCTFTPPFGPPD